VIVLLNSGNLATTQTVVSSLRKAFGTAAPNLSGLDACSTARAGRRLRAR
jgi:predicted proteasome-type protease